MGSKGHGSWFVIGGFRSVLCVSVFQGSLLMIVIMIDGSENVFWAVHVKYACQPEVGFLHVWAVVLLKVLANLLYKRKETQLYNFGSV